MTLHTSTCSFSSPFFLTLLHVQPSLATSHSHTTYNFLHNICIFYSSLQVMHPCGLELAIALSTFSSTTPFPMSKPSFLFTSSTFGPLKHVVQIKVALTAVRISFTPLHLLCTHFRQPVHWIEFLPTPFLHTAHGHLVGSSSATLPSPAIITFVFPTFTFNPFASMPSFHLSILSRNSPIFFAINTRSSAYKSSHGSPTLKPLVTISITTTNSRGLKIDP